MSEIKLTINNKEITARSGQTILEIAALNGIEIPTLCHDERVEIFGSCGLCTVEINPHGGVSPRLFRACATVASDGMVVNTETERVRRNRTNALELLLSEHRGDCKPPCTLACPAETECQGYVNLIAEGKEKEAYDLIMEKIPLPSSIGRVCPHPCEDACRRELVEEPIAIAALKQFAGDRHAAEAISDGGNVYEPELNTGKKIAVIGGGPGGLSAAYFLRLKGHGVTVFDSMPYMGGMLRYGIPEYRLPKELLQKEIDVIKSTGVEMRNNTRIGSDITLGELREKYDAVIVAVGAWTSSSIRCEGEDLNGVLGGIDFLRESPDIRGKTVAVVGGGNTAMDACRTAVRLGADTVYNIYRRTRNEMPAEEIEITEAEEEGVVFKNLTNPIKIIGDAQNNVKSIHLQIMELGEPDASGRRAPVAVHGKEETLDVDIVISAIGQKLNPAGFEELNLTKWGTIAADTLTFATDLKGVFAIGDAVNDGAGIAVTAIGQAKKAAEAINIYLDEKCSKCSLPRNPYLVKDEKTAEDFKGEEKYLRVKMPHRSPEERRGDFKEINFGFSEEQAKREASRCLKCGCRQAMGGDISAFGVNTDCKLLNYANQYDVKPDKYNGLVHKRGVNTDIPNVNQNPEKCVLCGLCIRLCEEEVGAGVLGFVGRGYDTKVKAAGDLTPCENCGKCAEVCPTGALVKIRN
ncbi:MAG: FAD-dependent oxidoreductase [Oscillospiraceae bacterium]|nr:FAD-dependent oxidoreductase [Oscillospiraceae bacterium]